jgi:hypothetical protein
MRYADWLYTSTKYMPVYALGLLFMQAAEDWGALVRPDK